MKFRGCFCVNAENKSGGLALYLKECLKFRGCFCVNAENKSGGLALYWVNGVSLEVIYDNKNIIAYLVYSNPPSDVWLLLEDVSV